ncbi:hypothetical protein LCGC14_3023060, partial [marine sediment metagenome]
KYTLIREFVALSYELLKFLKPCLSLTPQSA